MLLKPCVWAITSYKHNLQITKYVLMQNTLVVQVDEDQKALR